MSADENYIPKEATQQREFLKKYPTYDGRGIKIAVIDTDIVDLSLPGMQKTTTGLPKIIDCLDRERITVDTSKIVETIGNNFIIGLSGRKLEIPSSWGNISDKWHVGSVPFEKLSDIKLAGNEFIEIKKELNIDKDEASIKEKTVDCIVWFDGEKWQTCIDTSFSSNLENVKVLTNFDTEHDVVTNELIYGVNISDDGNLLQLLQPLHFHGSIVTQVAAAYFPDNPNASGLAPGAQIVSINYGDLKAAFLKCIEMDVDIVSLSITFCLTEEERRIMNKMVEDHEMIIVQIAGNQGPFYSSTTFKYSELSEQTLIVGSVFTADQLILKDKFEYTEDVNTVQNYSSKGPLLPSGSRCVDFVAPGAAIIDLPKWYKIKNKACHGTSLAVPNVAGSIACLLSALKANNIQYSPFMIKFALAKTAYLLKGANKLAYGNGIIQIKDAFEFIQKSINNLPLKYLVPISTDLPDHRGIICYQDDYQLPQIYRYCINTDSALDTKWILKCFPSDSRKFIFYQKTDNFFSIKIDTALLEEGSINYAEIYGVDSLNPSIGPLFYLPITVICPAKCTTKEIAVKPGQLTHFFLSCPSETKQCCIKIASLNKLDGKKESEITIEYCQKQKLQWIYKPRQKHAFKFTAKDYTKNLTINVGSKDEYVEICFYHVLLDTKNFKLDFSFLKSKK